MPITANAAFPTLIRAFPVLPDTGGRYKFVTHVSSMDPF